MKKAKLTLSIAISALLIFLLCACGGAPKQTETAAETTAAADVTEEISVEETTETTVQETTAAAQETTAEEVETTTAAATEAPAEPAGDAKALLSDLLKRMDSGSGIHMSYHAARDYMNSEQDYDVHNKGEIFYSAATTRVSGYENTLITYFKDKNVYNLDPDKKTGTLVMEDISIDLLGGNILMMDSVYSAIASQANVSDFTVETSEIEGKSYTALIYPATEYTAERTFYFDENGQLAYFREGAPAVDLGVDIGETFYTIYAIDDKVDETLFDISEYEIEKW